MIRMKTFILAVLFFTGVLAAQSGKNLIIRCDDIGMSHAVNLAAQEMTATGIPFSASVMFVCPWYLEAVEILKNQPHVTAGIHLTLNAEWKNYRWGPVAGKDAVPSLVDEKGFFFPSRGTLFANNPNTAEIEKELRAQIERALKSGLKVEYVDYHMGTAVDKPEYRAIVENLAGEYNLGISRYFGEIDVNSMYFASPETKIDTLINTVNKLNDSVYSLLVCHIGKDTPELAAMVDLNIIGPNEMSKNRNAELEALKSKEFSETLKKNNVELITYSDLIKKIGLGNMESPLNPGIKIYGK